MTEAEEDRPPTHEEAREIIRRTTAMQTLCLDRATPHEVRKRETADAFAFGGNYAMLVLAATVTWRFERAAEAWANGKKVLLEFPREQLAAPLIAAGNLDQSMVDRCLDLCESLISSPGDTRRGTERTYQLIDELMETDNGGLVAFFMLNLFAIDTADMVASFDPEIPDRIKLVQVEALEHEQHYGGIL